MNSTGIIYILKIYWYKLRETFSEEYEVKAENVAKKINDETVNFKFTTNRKQFEFNLELDLSLKKAERALGVRGWSTVEEYLSDDLASDSEDDKKLRQAEDRTGRKPRPYKKRVSDAKEIDFFHEVFPVEWYGKIAAEINRYAAEKISQNGADPKWTPTNAEEIRAFFAFNITMAIVVAPNQDMYFTSDTFFRPTWISERITRDRFDKLCQYFHVCDTRTNPQRGQPGFDKLAHIRSILEDVRQKCKTVYSPHCETSIDEAMIAYTGRLGFKQYVPLKPTKRGIKVWVRADPHNGFVNDFQVYTGKSENAPEVGLGERVVKDLTRDIWGSFHRVYCDNYFTSVPLFQELLRNKTYACGTFRSNRKHLPPAVTKAKLKQQGNMVQNQQGNMVATAWHDLLSTCDSPVDMTSVQRRKKDGTVRDVPCPKVVKNYTSHMNGVDRADQLRSTYSISRKASKWWKYLFWFLVDISITNGYIMMKESPNHQLKSKTGKTKERTQLDFRKNLPKQLMGAYWLKRKRESVQNKSVQGLLHWPTILTKKRTCKQCSKQGLRKEPTSGCEQCQIHLCVACFKPYHKENFPALFQ
ncbi:piggyBac transposable element-derived protein 4-like [Pecten maximus]|uniref:piggyBac transposable element-derived protein 4-like n=1 Tax=Pecten maximus TaxID=6579 RepID=UPI001458FE08|nr:piggyBac transposable element-derived protein 4-like [Pecten maximus]